MSKLSSKFPSSFDQTDDFEVDGKTWIEWRVALLRELKFQRGQLEVIINSVQEHETEIAILKTKLAVYSSIAAAVPTILSIILQYLQYVNK